MDRFWPSDEVDLRNLLDPARVDTDRHACLKSVPRQVLGKPVTRDLRAIPALPPQR
jgi:hypothetical protein